MSKSGADIVGITLLILLLCFLFTGEPDLWDVLHAKAMSTTPASTGGNE